ncbi:MAG: AIR synthase-related protein [Patescibacteria group bacterium]
MTDKSHGEYAKAGVDYGNIRNWKAMIKQMGRQTLTFPNARHVFVESDAHAASYEYRGGRPHRWGKTLEGLGNKEWIAELMYSLTGDTKYFSGIGVDAVLMSANDVVAHGYMPVVGLDEIAAGDDAWFADSFRAEALIGGFFDACQMLGMALAAGESPAYKYLIKAEPPVVSAPTFSACVTGIVIDPERRYITGKKLAVGDVIIGATSSGGHANGASLLIKRGMALPEGFLTKLPNGETLGAEALIPTRSYVALVEALLDAEIDVHKFLPVTGGGVAKAAADSRLFNYRIHTWCDDVPPLFRFMAELGVSREDLLTTFNWGIGWLTFVPRSEAVRTIQVGTKAGYEMFVIGRVEEGDRRVIFQPDGEERIDLRPPGE